MKSIENFREIFTYLREDRTKIWNIFQFFSICLIFVIFPFSLYGQDIFDFRPEAFGIVSINEPWKKNNIPLSDKIHYYITRNSRNNTSFSRQFQVDSTSLKFVIRERLSNFDMNIPQVLDIEEVVKKRIEISNKEIFSKRFNESAKEKIEKSDERQGKGFGFSIPMPVQSKTIQSIIGSDINLNITGKVGMKGNLIQRDQNIVKTNINQSSDYTFKLEQTQRFKIGGNIGKLVTMDIDQDSQRDFDFLNTIDLHYTGEEDAIFTDVWAGNIELSLPATRFVTFSGSNQGLFGLKSSIAVGPIKLTTIASLEKGQKQKLSLKGGAKAQDIIIKDYEYVKGTYFFVDEFYRRNFKFNDRILLAPDEQDPITDIEVWKAGKNYHLKPDSRYGWALYEADMDMPQAIHADTLNGETQNIRIGNFVRLEQNEDYFVNKEFGYIILNQRAMNEIIAVSYKTLSGKEQGTLAPEPGQVLILKMIRTDDPRPSDKVWDLEWKNVYFLRQRNIDPEGIEISIVDNRSGAREKIQSGGKNYLEIFNLDRRTETGEFVSDDKVDINNPNIFNFFRGELIFPDKRPFDPEGNSDLLNEKRNPDLYDKLFINQSQYAEISKFDIEVKLSSASATYNLGFNLLPGSEEINLGGMPLAKGQDYEIDYNTGQLQILNEMAIKPGADLDIKYENGEIFQLDKKTLLGMRSEYNFMDNGFIGFTGIMLSERILEQRVRLGQEPIKNFVWDINSRFTLEPNIITEALDFLPIIDTNAPSKLLFEGELGQVMPNPNTINVGSMGDINGIADLDNFEGSSMFTTVPIMRKSWYRSSIPFFDEQTGIADPAIQFRAEKRGKLVWYNPWLQVPIKEIFPYKDVNTRTGTMTNVLVLKRITDINHPPEPSIFEWWSGITTPLSTSYYNQSETRFIEIWIKGERGKVHFDMGLISEDAIPNGILNTEDIAGGRANGILDSGEDKGLDGIEAKDGTNPQEKFDDDWSYTFKSDDYNNINGTEGNGSGGKIDGVLIPDTEDINRNGVLDTRNDYFEYTFTLGRSHSDFDSLVVGGQDNTFGWRLYRIPIDRAKKKGNPDLTRIEFARIWVEGLDVGEQVEIASINLTGNDWKELGVSSNLDSADFKKRSGTIEISVINTDENKETYEPPREGLQIEDRITGAKQREQSLAFKYENIAPEEAAAIQKSFMKEQDAIHYKELKMFVHGDENINVLSDSTSDVIFFFRFGRDKNNYFEVREYLFPGWDERNELRIPTTKLSGLEFEFPETKAGYPEWGEGKFYRIVGSPTVRHLQVVTAGIINKGRDFKSGELWMDEMRVSNVEKVKGIAMRTRTELTLADIGKLSGDLEKKDSDFHNVNDRWGSGGNTLTANLVGNFDLGRIISSERILTIPISFNYGKNQNVPKYLTGKDILTKSGSVPDSLIERETILTKTSSFNFSFKKNIPSKNWFIKNTIDKMSLSYSGSQSFSKDYNTKFNRNNTGKTTFSYTLPIPSDKLALSPFGWLGEETFLIGALNKLKFSLIPNSFGFSANTSENKTSSKLRGGKEKKVKSFNLSRNLSLGFMPINNLPVTFTRNYNSDMRDVKNKFSIFTGNFGKELSTAQNIGSSFQAKLFSWLTNRFNYTSNYSLDNNIQLPEAGKKATNRTQKQADVTIDLAEMFRLKKSETTKSAGAGNVRIRRPIIKDEKEKKEESEDKEKKSFFLFRGFASLIKKVNPISLKYSQTVNVQSVGLEANPSLKYQFGLDNDPGVSFKANVGTNQGSVIIADDFNIETGFNFASNIKSSLKYLKRDNTTERANTYTGNISETYLILGDKKIPFFNWNFSWSGLEKLKFLSSLFRTVSFSHIYSGTKETQLQTADNVYIPITESYTSGFKPLAGLTFNWKNGISSKLTWTVSETISDNLKVNSSSKVVQQNISFITTYLTSGGFKLPLPFLGSKKVDNNINFRFTFNMSSNATFNNNPQGEYIKFSENSNWSLKPEITYNFSSRINGGMHFELMSIKDNLSGKKSTKDFGISVDIIIAGS